jgi:glycerol-3-phosphate O-acyltransferase
MDRFTGTLLPWLRFTVRPADAAERVAQADVPVCYVLGAHRALDVRVLQRACARAGLPRPRKLLFPGSGSRLQSLLVLTRKLGFWRRRVDRRPPPELRQMLDALAEDPARDVLLVPVAVYWGRAPRREYLSWFRLLFSEDWVVSGGIGRALAVLLNGRNIGVEFGPGVSLRSLANGGADSPAARRVARHLAGQLDASRTAYVGPDLSHQRTLMTEVLRGRSVRAIAAQEARDRKIPRRQALLEAKGMFQEIAADYSHVFVRMMERVLRRLWTRIYDGVHVSHIDSLSDIAAGSELVYVPCHRSTMDDLLMPYAIYTHGFAVPHIAAGINLNLPVIGRMMRKGGTFFLRRSFRGSPLYSAVFTRYLGAIMARGHPIQYFVEGGRSRSGRSLAPKTGMLSMTLRSYLRQPVRPVVFVPVYIGYERIMEIDSYLGELSGKPKEKENIWGFLRSLKRLRENFGQVHVNIGEPIPLQPLLDEHVPDWRDRLGQEGRAAAVGSAVDVLAARIMRRIHAAAAVTPVNLLAITMLAAPRQAMLEADLQQQLEVYLKLLRAAPYSSRVTVTELDAPAIIKLGFERQLLTRLGADAIGLDPQHAPGMAYYRNNVLHLVAMPSLLACCFLSSISLRTSDVLRLAGRIYPYVCGELFLRWEEGEVPAVVQEQLAALRAAGLLRQDPADPDCWQPPAAASAEAVQLSLLAQPMLQTLQRYYLAIALLLHAGSGQIAQAELGAKCQEMARRIVTLYGFYSPEFFDRTLFDGFLAQLRRRGVIRGDAEGRLVFDDVLERVAEDAQLVLSEQLRHSILQVVHG